MELKELGSKATSTVESPGNTRVILNVGGTKHEVLWRRLERLPDTRLGKLRTCDKNQISKLCDDYSEADNEFFFDRQSKSFSNILDFYRTGKLHLVDEMCPVAFGEELEFWGIDETSLDVCCFQKYQQLKKSVMAETIKNSTILKEPEEEFFNGSCLTFRKFHWDLFEKQQNSFPDKFEDASSFTFILLLG